MRMPVVFLFLLIALMGGCAGANLESSAPAGGTRLASGCLKEGELCNPLNDQCCAGYYCFGGLAPTCFRKP